MHGPACIFWASLTPFSLQARAGAGRVVIANNNATAGVGGRHFERWTLKSC
jgi:hypothetical protein